MLMHLNSFPTSILSDLFLACLLCDCVGISSSQCLSLISKVFPIFTCPGNGIPFFILLFSHFLHDPSLSPSVFLPFCEFYPLAFDSPLKYGLILSSCLPPRVGYCLSVLLYGCWELISGPSAVIQLSHSLLSPIHSAPLCPSPRHRPATLLLTTTLLPLTTLSGLLLSGWYTTRERTMPAWAVFLEKKIVLCLFSPLLLTLFSKWQPA